MNLFFMFFANPLKNLLICVILIFVMGKPEELKRRLFLLKHIRTINKANLKATAEKGGCGRCQSSCQSACKTSCTVANQKCEKIK